MKTISLANGSTVSAIETFDGTWPFEARYTEAPGFRMHYVDEGQGETLLALHGEPTWGYLFRDLIQTLSPQYRVVVPDHMGFGKSETPSDRSYFLQDHIDNLERFVLDLDLRDITLVMHDFGGPAGMGLAIRHPERIRRIISTNGPTPFNQPGLGDALAKNAVAAPWFSWIAKANAEGTLEQILGQLDYNILSTLKLNGFERHERITDTWLRAYGAPFQTPEDCLGAIGWAKGYAKSAHRFEPVDAPTARALSRKPALALWGMADRTLQPEHFIPLFHEAFPNGTVHHLEGVGHYSLEDAPEEIAKRIGQFLIET
jgi:pimeloyl-ACP methyl ester carboxylesterase